MQANICVVPRISVVRRCSIQLKKYNPCILVKPNRALSYNNQAVKHGSQPVLAVLATYLQKSSHLVLTSTCSLFLAFHFIIAQHSCPTVLAKAHEAVEPQLTSSCGTYSKKLTPWIQKFVLICIFNVLV